MKIFYNMKRLKFMYMYRNISKNNIVFETIAVIAIK